MRLFLLFALALVPVGGSAYAKPTASSAKAFLESLYVPYRAEPTKVVDALQRPDLYFEAGLVRAMQRDSDEAAKLGEVPQLDGDPICDCQDYIPFKAAIGPVKVKGNRAQAVVTFDNARPQRLEYELIATRAGWRIYDIKTSDYRLRSLLKL
jgi:hypothetical protein